MNKIVQYLNKHIAGEITADPTVRKQLSRDGSVLKMTPAMVAYPVKTSDIRKLMTFAWQLAEKGHTLSLTARGSGMDTNGAALSDSVLVMIGAHMTRVFELDKKQHLVRVQPGVSVESLQNSLGLLGVGIIELVPYHPKATVGGIIASTRQSIDFVDTLEVVLANGDVLQTGRLSNRELAKKQGLQSLEGNIYREIDALIIDNQELINEKLHDKEFLDHGGYGAIAQVKTKKSFDLTPLFAGSQGTLGIISEMILKTNYVNHEPAIVVACFAQENDARDAVDNLAKFGPTTLEYIDTHYFDEALKHGKQYEFYDQARSDGEVAAIIVLSFNDFNKRSRVSKLKRAKKQLSKHSSHVFTATDETDDLFSAQLATRYGLFTNDSNQSHPPIIDGIYLPSNRFEEFSLALTALANKHHVALPLYGRPLENLWFARPSIDLSTVGGKQKVIRLIAEVNELVLKHGGTMLGASGEGRLKNVIVQSDTELAELYAKVRAIFDTHSLLNGGVKQSASIQELTKLISSDYLQPDPTHPPVF